MKKTLRLHFYLVVLLSSCNFYDGLFKEKKESKKAPHSAFYKVSFHVEKLFSKEKIVSQDLRIMKNQQQREASPAPQELYWEQSGSSYRLHIARNLVQNYQGHLKIVTASQRKKSLPFQLQLNEAGELIFIGRGNPNRYTDQKWSKDRQEIEFKWLEKPLFENRRSSKINLSYNNNHLFWINDFGEFALAKMKGKNFHWISLPGERAREPANKSCLSSDALLLASPDNGLLIASLADHTLKRSQLLPFKDITHLSCHENTIALNSRSKGLLMLQLEKDKLLSQNSYAQYFPKPWSVSDLQLTKEHLLVAFEDGGIQIGERNKNDITLFTYKSFATQGHHVEKFYTGEERLAWLDNKGAFFSAELTENELIWKKQDFQVSGQDFAAFFVKNKLFFTHNHPFEIYAEPLPTYPWQRLTQVSSPLDVQALVAHPKWIFAATEDALFHAKKINRSYWKLQ